MTDAQTSVVAVPTNVALVHPEPRLPLDQHPAAVYLARLGQGSRRTMSDALDIASRAS